MKNKISLILLLCLFLPGLIRAQLEWGGSAEFLVSAAGKDSKFIRNGVPADFTNTFVSIRQFNFLLFAEISPDFFFEGRLQFDNLGSGELNPPLISLANVVWQPEDQDVALTLGRFITPFGLFPQRQLPMDNTFIQPPAAYAYFSNISNSLGFVPNLTATSDYVRGSGSSAGIPTVYFCAYATGAMLSHDAIFDWLRADLAVSNVALGSTVNNTNLSNYNFIARLQVNPHPSVNIGLSGSHGSFFEEVPENSDFGDLRRFTQSIAGLDYTLAYAFFELSGEALYSSYRVPWWSPGQKLFFTDADGQLKEYTLTKYDLYADLRLDMPFLPGSYLAARYEYTGYPEFSDDMRIGQSNAGIWDNSMNRYAVAIGYKFHRQVLWKLVYTDQTIKNFSPELEDYTLQSTLTIAF